jgi:hypothetical protein
MIEPLLEAERALTVGMLDHAERLYRTVAESDPRNSIAVVGLARVAIERGDDLGALRLGRRALRIDRENPAAQGLVRRLEEVLTQRGVEVPAEGSELASEEGSEAAPTPAAQKAAPTPADPSTAAPSPSAPELSTGQSGSRRPLLARLLRRG